MHPHRSAGGPATPPPAPAAPAATGRLRRLPVVLLVVAVFVAGLGYAGYRQLTGGPPDGFRAATSPGYELAVPQTWTPPAPGTPPLTVFGVPFGVAGQYGEYGCRDARFTRAVAASALIAVPADVGLDQAATAFARGAGEALYPGAGPQVAVGTPSERQLSTVTGSRVEATVRTDGSAGCRATDATVQVLVMPRTTAADGSDRRRRAARLRGPPRRAAEPGSAEPRRAGRGLGHRRAVRAAEELQRHGERGRVARGHAAGDGRDLQAVPVAEHVVRGQRDLRPGCARSARSPAMA